MNERRVLATCNYCGLTNVQSHAKYNDRCDMCGKRYAKYTNYRALQKSNYTVKRDAALADIISEYKALQAAGFRVPDSIRMGGDL